MFCKTVQKSMLLLMFDNDERTIELTERFDVDKARQLLLSDLLDAKGKRILGNYLTKLSGNAMQVQYTNESLGRLEANVLGLKKNGTCSSQMNLWNVMKAVGCSGIYTDIDIVNCHPVLMTKMYSGLGDTYNHWRIAASTTLSSTRIFLTPYFLRVL